MNKKSNRNLILNESKIEGWDGLIALTERRLLRAKIQVEEIAATLDSFRKKRKVGDPWPSATQN